MSLFWENTKNYVTDNFTLEKDANGNKTGNLKNSTLITAGAGALDKVLGNYANNIYYKDINPNQLSYYEAVYGNANLDPLMRLFTDLSGTNVKNAKLDILNKGNKISSEVGSNQDLLLRYDLMDKFTPLKKQGNFWSSNLENISAFGKGFVNGLSSSGGNIWAGLFAGIGGGLANWGSQLTRNKSRKSINNAMNLANKIQNNNYDLAVNQSKIQNSLNSRAGLTVGALGGALDYDLQNLYAINNYMNTLNKSKITSLPNSFLKPQFDSVNYFAMGGSPDFNYIGNGGTHEENSNGGVPIKHNTLLELDETIVGTPQGDYVFSDRLKLSEEECKTLKVPIGSTYAEASVILRKEYDEKPNDEIAKKGWEQSRDMLILSLELQKQEIALKEARKQGLNSPKMLGIDSQIMQDMYYSENPQGEAFLQRGINPNILNAFGGLVKKYATGSFINPNTPPPDELNNSPLVGFLPEEHMPTLGTGNGVFKYYNLDKGFNGSTIYNTLGYLPEYLNWLKDTLDFGLYFTEEAKKQMLNKYNSTKGTNLNWQEFNSKLYNLGSDNVYGYYTKMLENAYNNHINKLTPPLSNPEPVEPSTEEQSSEDNSDLGKDKTKNKDYLKYAPLAANLIGLSQNLFTPEDYSLPNRLLQEINVLPRVSAPRFGSYMTYNPTDINRITNQYNAQTAALRNAIMNTSNPNRNAALAAAMYNANIGYGDLVLAIEALNAKERQAVQLYNNSLDQANAANQMLANQINQNYDLMRINGIMQELAMRDAIQTARANAIQGNLKGLTDTLSGIAQLAQNDRWFDVYMAGLPHELTMLQRLANGEDINELIMEFTPGYLNNERTKFIENLKKNPRYKDYISQITIR